MKLQEVEAKIIEWGKAKGILDEATPKDQYIKMVEEVGEVGSALNKNKQEELKSEIGDVFVTLSLFAQLNGTNVTECATIAYDKIKDRKGKMINGTLVKEKDW